MKKWMNNGPIIAVVTAVLVASAAVAVLLHASDLERVFNPEDYSRFESLYENSDKYDTVAGDGEDSDLADEDEDGEDGADKDSQKALKVAEDENKNYDPEGNSLGMSDGNSTGGERNPDAFEIGDGDGHSSLGVTDGGNNGNNGGSGNGSGNNDGNGGTGDGTGSGGSGSGNGSGGDNPGGDEPGTHYIPTAWDKEQLEAKDPVMTEHGELVGLTVNFKLGTPYYYQGDEFQASDAEVTAEFRLADGTSKFLEIPYGGADGYSVNMSTSTYGTHVAIFNYQGYSVRKNYTVRSVEALIRYYSEAEGKVYAQTYPGPLRWKPKQITKLENEVEGLRSGSSGILDFSKVHNHLIYILGDKDVKKSFEGEGNEKTYGTVTLLQEDTKGYLTKMLCGFKNYDGGLETGDYYIYYPIKAGWSSGLRRKFMDVVEDVPTGYKIKRGFDYKDIDDKSTYMGKQILEKYEGTAPTVEVPMGVTHIELKAENPDVRGMELPESIVELTPGDIEAIAKYFPKLENYTAKTAGNEEYIKYTVTDGVLYNQDGTVLLSVPPGKTSINTWSNKLTTIAENAFYGSSIKELVIPDTVTTLQEGCFAGFAEGGNEKKIIFKGENPPVIEPGTGIDAPGIKTILVPDSAQDVVLKDYIFAFGESGLNTDNIGAEDKSGQEIAGKSGQYAYVKDDKDRDILVWNDEPGKLAALPADISGEYTVGKSVTAQGKEHAITSIGEGAFAGCTRLEGICLPENVAKLEAGSLIVPDSVETVTLLSDHVDIDSKLFGEPDPSAPGSVVPDIRVSVPEEVYEEYLKEWGDKLDPVYGGGTAKKLLTTESINYVYEDDAKYLKITAEGGSETYRLLKVYSDRTLYEVKEGVTEIAAGAFDDCGGLEILCLPKSLAKVEEQVFAKCGSLEMVTVSKESLLADASVKDGAKVLQAGNGYDSFFCDTGVLYGKKSGKCTLLNVPTDYSQSLAVRADTVCLGAEALKDCHSVAGLTCPASITEIGDRCFENFKVPNSTLNLENLTDLKTMGKYVFKGCQDLKTLKLPRHLTTIAEGLCCDCLSLEKVSAGWEKITSVGDKAFYSCEVFGFPEEMTAVQSLGSETFYGCRAFTRVDLPATLQNMGEQCFSNCVELQELYMDGTIHVISRECFAGCRSLNSLEFSQNQKKELRLIGAGAFSACALVELDVSDLLGLNQMGEGVFADCTSLEKITLPAALENLPDSCFSGCQRLALVKLTSTVAPTLGGQIFGEQAKRSKYVSLRVRADSFEDYKKAYDEQLDAEYGENASDELLQIIDENKEEIRGLTYVKEGEGWVLTSASKDIEGDYTVKKDTTRIADDAFLNCTKLTQIKLPKGSEVTLGNRCFIGCSSLRYVYLYGDIPEWGDETFMGCTGIAKITMSSGNVPQEEMNKIHRIGTRAFKGCTGLEEETAVSLLTLIDEIGEESFADCTKLPSVGIRSEFVANLKVIGDRAFENCESLSTPLTSKYVGLRSIGAYAFRNCDSLEGPSVAKNVAKLGEGCFEGCDNLTTVSIYGGIEEYPKDCFKNCPKLTRTGGKSAALKGLKRIGEGAYQGCSMLTTSDSWNLGRYPNLKIIGANAFKDCTNISYVDLSATVAEIGTGAFDGCTGIGKIQKDDGSMGTFTLRTLFSKEDPGKLAITIGAIDLNTLTVTEDGTGGFLIRVPDSMASGDNVYLAYLELFKNMFGEENALKLLDSISDGAKGRHNPQAATADAASDEEVTGEELPGDEPSEEEMSGSGQDSLTPNDGTSGGATSGEAGSEPSGGETGSEPSGGGTDSEPSGGGTGSEPSGGSENGVGADGSGT